MLMKKHTPNISSTRSFSGSLFWTAAAIAVAGATSVGAAANAPLPQPTQDSLVAQEDEPSTTHGGIKFAHLSFDNAVSRAERTGKILVLLWVDAEQSKENALCGQVFGDGAVQRWMKENAIAVRIDASERKKDAKKAGVLGDSTPMIDILDIARGGRIERIRSTGNATLFLAAVFGIGTPERPTGETATEPFSWLAWANSKFRDAVDPKSGELAVQGYAWCLQNADAVRPGFRAKYLEFLLQRVAMCKLRTHAAIRVLEKEYATLDRRLNHERATRVDVYEVTRVAYWMRNEERTMELYKNLRGDFEQKKLYRRWLYSAVAPILGRFEDYDEMLDVVADKPIEMFQARIKLLKHDAGAETEGGATPADELAVMDYGTSTLPYAIQDSRADIIDDASWTYEALLYVKNRDKDAHDLMLLITTTFPVNRAFGLFIERAQRLKRWGLSAEIADIGMGVLDEKGQRRMQRLLDRIPKDLPEPSEKVDGSKGDEKDGQ